MRKFCLILTLLLLLWPAVLSAQDNAQDTASLLYIPLVADQRPINGDVGDQFSVEGTAGLVIESVWGVKLHAVLTDGDCFLDDEGTRLELFCYNKPYTVIFSSDYGQRIRVKHGVDTPGQLYMIFGDAPPLEEMPYVIYLADQRVEVNRPAYSTIQIANMAQGTRSNSVYYRVPGGDLVENGPLPASCQRPENGSEIVCYGVDVVPASVYQLRIPLVWTRVGTFRVETFVLDAATLIRGGRLFRTVSVDEETVTDAQRPEANPYIVHAFNQHVIVGDTAYYVVQVVNMGPESTSNTVTLRIPAANVVDVGALPSFCSLTGRSIVCRGVNVPPSTIVRIAIPFTWKMGESLHDMEIRATDSNGNELRGSPLTRRITVF